MESILTSIKKLLGIDEDYTHFDTDIIIYINSVFSKLRRIGVGPITGFFISDKEKTWTDYLREDENVGDVQTYMYLKVRLLFDPPSSSIAVEAIERQIKELEWGLQVDADLVTMNTEGVCNG